MPATLTVDLSNKSATITSPDHTVTLIWSGVTRRSALDLALNEGYYPAGAWTLTSPPDGFQLPITRAIRETWPCDLCGHKHYPRVPCPDHKWADGCPYEGVRCAYPNQVVIDPPQPEGNR